MSSSGYAEEECKPQVPTEHPGGDRAEEVSPRVVLASTEPAVVRSPAYDHIGIRQAAAQSTNATARLTQSRFNKDLCTRPSHIRARLLRIAHRARESQSQSVALLASCSCISPPIRALATRCPRNRPAQTLGEVWAFGRSRRGRYLSIFLTKRPAPLGAPPGHHPPRVTTGRTLTANTAAVNHAMEVL